MHTRTSAFTAATRTFLSLAQPYGPAVQVAEAAAPSLRRHSLQGLQLLPQLLLLALPSQQTQELAAQAFTHNVVEMVLMDLNAALQEAAKSSMSGTHSAFKRQLI